MSVPPHVAGFSEAAWRALEAREGDEVEMSHPAPVESMSHVRILAGAS